MLCETGSSIITVLLLQLLSVKEANRYTLLTGIHSERTPWRPIVHHRSNRWDLRFDDDINRVDSSMQRNEANRQHSTVPSVFALSPLRAKSGIGRQSLSDEPTALGVAFIDYKKIEPSLNWEKQEFVSSPQSVFIEDTDSYGVMYNGNYLRAYERALHMHFFSIRINNQKRRSDNMSSSICIAQDDWSIVNVDVIKFKVPAALGDTFCIHGKLKSSDDDNCSEVWDMCMQSPDGGIIFNTATGVSIARPPELVSAHSSMVQKMYMPRHPPLASSTLLHNGSTGTSSGGCIHQSSDRFIIFRDEFDGHMKPHVPLRSCLNFMERSRSNFIGGPKRLQQLQTDDNILYVVASIRHCALLALDYDHADHDRSILVEPGQEVTVDTTFALHKQGMWIDCYHTLLIHNSLTGTWERMAQGLVTLLALNARSRKPTKHLPEWLVEQFLNH